MTIQERILLFIAQQESNILLRKEVALLGSSTQVTAALKTLQRRGVLVRIGTGVYAKTRTSSITGTTIPAGSLETLATEALKKLGVTLSAGRTASEYNSGVTTQIPGAFVANTGRRRIRRKIAVGNREIVYENNYTLKEFNMPNKLKKHCTCRMCLQNHEPPVAVGNVLYAADKFSKPHCPSCGETLCPRAEDHRLTCEQARKRRTFIVGLLASRAFVELSLSDNAPVIANCSTAQPTGHAENQVVFLSWRDDHGELLATCITERNLDEAVYDETKHIISVQDFDGDHLTIHLEFR